MNKLNHISTLSSSLPLWMMRQAGRYLPEYKDVRKTTTSFLDLCYDIEKAVTVTLQPISRFSMDAAIVFSDILVLPDILGWNIRFEENIGPILKQFTSKEDFLLLDRENEKKRDAVYEIISKTRSKLNSDKALIGFAGGPWTVMSYMLEGRSKTSFEISKKFIYENKSLSQDLLELLTEKTTDHLIGQIKAGADIIQIFDSWAGILSEEEFDRFVTEPTKQIVKKIKAIFPLIPIIGFPRGAGFLYEKYIDKTEIDVIGVDQFVPLNVMKKWSKKIVVQGNLDPVILLTNKEIIEKKAHELISNFAGKNYIFNLGHGILPNTPVENVEFLVKYVKEFKF